MRKFNLEIGELIGTPFDMKLTDLFTMLGQ